MCGQTTAQLSTANDPTQYCIWADTILVMFKETYFFNVWTI